MRYLESIDVQIPTKQICLISHVKPWTQQHDTSVSRSFLLFDLLLRIFLPVILTRRTFYFLTSCLIASQTQHTVSQRTKGREEAIAKVKHEIRDMRCYGLLMLEADGLCQINMHTW